MIDADGGANTSIFASEFNQFESFSTESRTATAFDSAVNGVLGFYRQSTDRKFRQEAMFAGAENSAADPTNRFVAYDKASGTDGETVSGYGEVIRDITDELQSAGGEVQVNWATDIEGLTLSAPARSRTRISPAMAGGRSPQSAGI